MKTIKLTLFAEISASHTPDRPAPFCNDHDSPLFSDAGDTAEVTDLTIEICGIDITDTIATYEKVLYNRIVDKLCNRGEINE